MKNTKTKSGSKLPSIPEDKAPDIKVDGDVRSFLFTDMVEKANKLGGASQIKRRSRSDAVTSEEEALKKEPVKKTGFVEKVSEKKSLQK
ncbi:MAG: hypothetical protein PQ612_01835 [Rickettsiales bacterium]|nr:hypothetical protein [Pseudomonadota bacterium]MDA0967134.1 hypothetical protein [Pseudomonadota bacterium]MDG4542380.1 hypothetical protein [Rickettsiales bacterium]MDG4544884.1 hypothetical protein [Rickettsiales bacterium]MDG4547007.1 hypothetical protein [Rickettsiales bacterium]